MEIPPELAARIDEIGRNRESGASEILADVIPVLRAALAIDRGLSPGLSPGRTLTAVAGALCRAQSSMASVWNAVIEALASQGTPERFERFMQRVARGPAALARVATECFSLDDPQTPLRLVTLSFSG